MTDLRIAMLISLHKTLAELYQKNSLFSDFYVHVLYGWHILRLSNFVTSKRLFLCQHLRHEGTGFELGGSCTYFNHTVQTQK